MLSLLVQGQVPDEALLSIFETVVSKVQSAPRYSFGGVRVLLLAGSKFFLRSNDYLGVVLLAVTDGVTQRIDISSAGAGSGLMGLAWGAGNSVEQQLRERILALLPSHGLQAADLPPA